MKPITFTYTRSRKKDYDWEVNPEALDLEIKTFLIGVAENYSNNKKWQKIPLAMFFLSKGFLVAAKCFISDEIDEHGRPIRILLGVFWESKYYHIASKPLKKFLCLPLDEVKVYTNTIVDDLMMGFNGTESSGNKKVHLSGKIVFPNSETDDPNKEYSLFLQQMSNPDYDLNEFYFGPDLSGDLRSSGIFKEIYNVKSLHGSNSLSVTKQPLEVNNDLVDGNSIDNSNDSIIEIYKEFISEIFHKNKNDIFGRYALNEMLTNFLRFDNQKISCDLFFSDRSEEDDYSKLEVVWKGRKRIFQLEKKDARKLCDLILSFDKKKI